MDKQRKIVDVHINLCDKNAKLPFYANSGDAGMDITASNDVIIPAGQTVLIPTGLKVAIPHGYEIQIRPRSGLSLNTPLRIPNSPGTIDCGYRDEIKVIMENTSPVNSGERLEDNDDNKFLTVKSKGNQKGDYKIFAGDRIAQMVLQKVPAIKWINVNDVEQIGENRGGGFGSSG